MIRSVGAAGPINVAGLVAWQLRWDLLAILIIAAVMVPIPDAVQSENAVAVLSVLGIAASIFIGFRNSYAYARWWEARTLWGGIIINSRALHNGLRSVDTGSAAMAAIADRTRRRQVRHAWQLAAEMRGIPPVPGVVELTPEDPADAVTPLDAAHDRPDTLTAQFGWLTDAGFEPVLVWHRRDLMVIAADRRPS